MKTAVKALALLSLLGGFAWVAGWGYWHFTIVGAISSLETGALPAPAGAGGYVLPPEPLAALKAAGTRALPYLVESLRPKRGSVFLAAVSDLVRREDALGPDLPPPIEPGDTSEDRAAKCEAIRSAWETFGAPKHAGWRWWKADPL